MLIQAPSNYLKTPQELFRTTPAQVAVLPQQPLLQDQLNTTLKTVPKFENIFDQIPVAQSVEASKAYLDTRLQAIKEQYVDRPIPDWKGNTKDSEPSTAGNLAYELNIHLAKGQNLARVNQVLSSAYPYRNVGTHFEAPIVGRKGDYDFTLLSLTPTIYQHLNNPGLTEEAKKHVIKNVLNQEGGEHLPEKWLFGLIPETENHILMTESSRYLKNQLVQKYGLDYSTKNLKPEAYDNQKNGFNSWFVNHLSQFAREDFDEYNSRPYQAYTVRSVQNMFDFAEDPKVQKSAHIIMDYISARFATQSSDLRRVVPFRRRQNYQGNDNLLEKDSQSSRFAVLAGNYLGFKNNTTNPMGFSSGHMLFPALSKYRVPDALLDIMINKGNNPYFMTSHHENTELVYAEENFTISAGGHHHDWSDLPFSKQENGLTMPTVVMLKNGGPSLSNMIRFEGRGDGGKVNNTGVYENFASGIRPVFPPELEKQLRKTGKLFEVGAWKFAEIDNVYVAFHSQSQSSPKNYAPSVGFVEVVDKKEFPSLATFMQTVQSYNPQPFNYYGMNRYTTSRGKTIDFLMAEPLKKNFILNPKAFGQQFIPPDTEPKTWNIKQVWDHGKPVPIETNFDKWPLVNSYTLKPEQDGQFNDYVVKADGTGQIIINNPQKNQSLLMSLADQDNPIRIEQKGEAVNLSQRAGIARVNTPQGFDITLDLQNPEHVRYLSLKWQKGSHPEAVQVFTLEEGQNNWKLAQQRTKLFTSNEHAFRTDFDLEYSPKTRYVTFRVAGRDLKLDSNPDVYQDFSKVI